MMLRVVKWTSRSSPGVHRVYELFGGWATVSRHRAGVRFWSIGGTWRGWPCYWSRGRFRLLHGLGQYTSHRWGLDLRLGGWYACVHRPILDRYRTVTLLTD